MADPIFADPRLAEIYDQLDPVRDDLDAYCSIVDELGAWSVLDVGCGTGALACRLAEMKRVVVGVDPARASLDVARRKPYADRVTWVHGDTSTLPRLQVDLAVMTGNVAQVFVSDDAWSANLRAIHAALQPGGKLVFESRDPAAMAWLRWTRDTTHRLTDVPDVGSVESWCDVTEVADDLVTFRWTYVFESDGAVLTSDSTLRFRRRETLEGSLRDSGFVIDEVRDAPDRPGQEFVFLASCAVPL